MPRPRGYWRKRSGSRERAALRAVAAELGEAAARSTPPDREDDRRRRIVRAARDHLAAGSAARGFVLRARAARAGAARPARAEALALLGDLESAVDVSHRSRPFRQALRESVGRPELELDPRGLAYSLRVTEGLAAAEAHAHGRSGSPSSSGATCSRLERLRRSPSSASTRASRRHSRSPSGQSSLLVAPAMRARSTRLPRAPGGTASSGRGGSPRRVRCLEHAARSTAGATSRPSCGSLVSRAGRGTGGPSGARARVRGTVARAHVPVRGSELDDDARRTCRSPESRRTRATWSSHETSPRGLASTPRRRAVCRPVALRGAARDSRPLGRRAASSSRALRGLRQQPPRPASRPRSRSTSPITSRRCSRSDARPTRWLSSSCGRPTRGSSGTNGRPEIARCRGLVPQRR